MCTSVADRDVILYYTLFFFLNHPAELGKTNKCQSVCTPDSEKPSLSLPPPPHPFRQTVLCLCRPACAQPRELLPGAIPFGCGCPCPAAPPSSRCRGRTSPGAGAGGRAAAPEALPADAGRCQQAAAEPQCALCAAAESLDVPPPACPALPSSYS